MKAVVVYDSAYGNTEKIAQSIGNTLGSPGDVEVLRVGSIKADQLAGVELLVAGSPTQKFRPLPAMVSFLKSIPGGGLKGVRVAAFDTRMTKEDIEAAAAILPFMVRIFGYAAKPIAGLLVKKGGELVRPPEGFLVEGMEGPLVPGELERAAAWARQLSGD